MQIGGVGKPQKKVTQNEGNMNKDIEGKKSNKFKYEIRKIVGSKDNNLHEQLLRAGAVLKRKNSLFFSPKEL